MQKKTLFAVLLTLAVVVAGTMLFLAQINTFGQAQNGAISGMIVLRDATGAGSSLSTAISLPGTSCEVKITNCNGTFTIVNQEGTNTSSYTAYNIPMAEVQGKIFPPRVGYEPTVCPTNCDGTSGNDYMITTKSGTTVEAVLSELDAGFITAWAVTINGNPNTPIPNVSHVEVATDFPGARKFQFTISWAGNSDDYGYLSCSDACTNPDIVYQETEYAYVVYNPSQNLFYGGFNPTQAGNQNYTFNCNIIDTALPGGTYFIDADTSYHLSLAYQCT